MGVGCEGKRRITVKQLDGWRGHLLSKRFRLILGTSFISPYRYECFNANQRTHLTLLSDTRLPIVSGNIRELINFWIKMPNQRFIKDNTDFPPDFKISLQMMCLWSNQPCTSSPPSPSGARSSDSTLTGMQQSKQRSQAFKWSGCTLLPRHPEQQLAIQQGRVWD